MVGRVARQEECSVAGMEGRGGEGQDQRDRGRVWRQKAIEARLCWPVWVVRGRAGVMRRRESGLPFCQHMRCPGHCEMNGPLR